MHEPFFEANMAALEANRPELVDIARTLTPSSLQTIEDSDGNTNLLDGNNQELWYTPTVAVSLDKLRNREDLRTSRLVALYGLGLGLELNTLLELRDKRTILVVEPDPSIFQLAMRVTDLRSAIEHPHVDWQVGLSLEQLQLKLHRNTMHARYTFFSKSIAQLVPHGAANRYPEYVVSASEIFLDSVKSGVRILGNDYNDALLGLENICRNISHIAQSKTIWQLKDLLKGQPAIVASAGPSLHRSLPYIKPIQDRIPIFCPDTSIRILQAAGIRPHVAASRERVEVSIRHFENLSAPDTVLACCPVLQPRILSTYHGPLALVYRCADFHEWLGIEDPKFDFNGSAGNLAFRLAALAGCDPIILVGQDLCFAENGNTHATGCSTGNKVPRLAKQRAIEALGSRGETVITTPRWLEFHQQYALDLAAHQGRVINATARGIHIPQTEVIDLPQIIPQLNLGGNPRSILMAACQPKTAEQCLATSQKLLARIQSTQEAYDEILKLLELGKAFAAKCKANFRPPEIDVVDLDVLITLEPYRTLDILRQGFFRKGGKHFLSFSSPVIQAILLEIEIDRYAKEREAKTATELAKASLAQYTRWFHIVDDLIRRSGHLLHIAAKNLSQPSDIPPSTLSNRRSPREISV